ncbi:uncharacterized protein [Drosophila pseudoobscura]|uniref:Diphosphomevalonate decarboxylase-like N-terminal domain-containing protein n=1 Tax=Drosophila pseudoobscura pseudoobscura TaxID=46245 RepID=A0A6I8VSS7_DROPS|nr:uncharacterized protein LOC117183640 [Drosophila pseudoobscura]
MRSVTCKAPVNIARIIYWGKRHKELILPINDSISMALGTNELCAKTTITASEKFQHNRMWLNDEELLYEEDSRLMSSSTSPPIKRTRNNAGAASERLSDALSPQLLEMLKDRFEEQTNQIASHVRNAEQRILSSLMERLDSIAGEVKQMGARVIDLEREVVDLRSQRDRLDERVERLDREVADLRTLGGRVGGIEARLAAEHMATSACELRIHGVPFVEGENVRALFNKLCFNLQLTPPPRIRDVFRARQTQHSNVDPVIIVKMENVREKINLLSKIGIYRRESKRQLGLQFFSFDSEAAVYVNEQFLSENYIIFKEAMRMKKHKILAAVFTRRGLVHV